MRCRGASDVELLVCSSLNVVVHAVHVYGTVLRDKLMLGQWRQSERSLFPAVWNQMPNTGI